MSRDRTGASLGSEDLPAREYADDLGAYLDVTTPPFYVPLGGSSSQVAPLHRMHNRFARHWFRPRYAHRVAAKLLIWPVFVLHRTLHKTRKYAGFVKKKTGKSALRQFWEQVVLVTVHGIPPGAYHRFQLFRDDRRAVAGEYLHRYETKPFLFPLLNRHADKKLLNDKLKFHEHCLAHGLPTPRCFASFPAKSTKELSIPPRDLLSKLRRGKGGLLVSRWTYRDGLYESPDGLRLDAKHLASTLDDIARRTGPIILQEHLTCDPSLLDLGAGVLSTVRIITCRNLENEPEAVCAVFRMPTQAGSVDNFHAGGVAARVHLETGKLSAAIGIRIKTRRHRVHPLRPEVQIKGRVLPHLPEALDLARRAHVASGPFVIIGWDVALTPAGPVLVEGNTNCDMDIIQRTHRQPIGQMSLGRYLSFQLQQISLAEIRAFQSYRKDAQDRRKREHAAAAGGSLVARG